MSKLILNIHNEAIMDKLLWMLEHFKNDGVEIEEYEKWKDIVSKSLKDYNIKYENSFEYKIDRAEFQNIKAEI